MYPTTLVVCTLTKTPKPGLFSFLSYNPMQLTTIDAINHRWLKPTIYELPTEFTERHYIYLLPHGEPLALTQDTDVAVRKPARPQTSQLATCHRPIIPMSLARRHIKTKAPMANKKVNNKHR
jgi:hypothetical protein